MNRSKVMHQTRLRDCRFGTFCAKCSSTNWTKLPKSSIRHKYAKHVVKIEDIAHSIPGSKTFYQKLNVVRNSFRNSFGICHKKYHRCAGNTFSSLAVLLTGELQGLVADVAAALLLWSCVHTTLSNVCSSDYFHWEIYVSPRKCTF